mgnify:CR=1 FL=1
MLAGNTLYQKKSILTINVTFSGRQRSMMVSVFYDVEVYESKLAIILHFLTYTEHPTVKIRYDNTYMRVNINLMMYFYQCRRVITAFQKL